MNESDAAQTLSTLVDLAAEDERKGLPSAHSWRRNELCAGSYQLSQEARKLGQEAFSEDSAASAKGDRIHAALADPLSVRLSESEAETANFLKERGTEQVKRIFGNSVIEEYREERYWLKLDSEPVASGRVDYLVISGDTALIVDWKTGFSEPEKASLNAQLKFLAVLIGAHFTQLKTVYVQIISGPYGVSEHCYDVHDLSNAWRSVVKTLRTVNDPRAGFSPSAEACKYCPAINICQAVKNKLLPMAKTQGAKLPAGHRAAQLLDEVELIQMHLDEIRAYYKRQVESGEQIPGWSLVPGAPKRNVTSWTAAREKLEEFIDKDKLDALAVYSVPAVEKLLGAAIGVKGPKLKDQLAVVLGDLLELKYPEPSLRKISEKP